MSETICFLGVGNMGSALIEGALGSGKFKSQDITAFDMDSSRLDALVGVRGISKAQTALEALKGKNYVFLCVKPQQMSGLLTGISEHITLDQCLVSIAAGITTQTIEKHFIHKVPVIRTMPNTPALVGCGMSALTKGRYASDSHLGFVEGFFSSVGQTLVFQESDFDSVTAISGSGPAYFFYMTEILMRSAEDLGFSKETASKLVLVTLQGAAKMLGQGQDPSEQRRKVTSPGGTTQAAIEHLKQQNWEQVFIEAVRKAKARSSELSKLY